MDDEERQENMFQIRRSEFNSECEFEEINWDSLQ